MWSETMSQIGTLQVRGVARDDPALRLAVSSQLGGLELKPAGMPPSAILIVRSLADPLPGRLSIRRGTARLCTDWERAVQGRMDELYRHAVRPQHGIAASDSDAIVFADEAELFACLVLDLSRGIAGQQWWWQLFLKSLSTSSVASSSIGRLMSNKAIYLPSLLSHLASWGKAGTVMRALNPEDALHSLSAMATVHQLRKVSAELTLAGTQLPASVGDKTKPLNRQDTSSRASKAEATSLPAEDEPDSERGHQYAARGPWRQWLGTSTVPKDLGREQAFLLGLGLVLHRMPSLARSSDFQKIFINWWNKSDVQVGGNNPLSSVDSCDMATIGEIEDFFRQNTTVRKPEGLPAILGKAQGADEAREAIQDSVEVKAIRETTAPFSSETEQEYQTPQFMKEHKQGDLPIPGTENTEPLPSDQGNNDKRVEGFAVDAESAAPIAVDQETKYPTASIQEELDAFAELEGSISTRLGGILYLINLMVQLDLPHCFEPDWRLASQLGAWSLLEVLGRALLEDPSGHYGEDPLWTALAELDGRGTGEPPGRIFSGNESFRIPVPWFQHVRRDKETFRWGAMRRRLRLWSGAGYLMVEIPRDENMPHDQAEIELQQYMGSNQKYLLSRSPSSKAPIDCPEHLKTAGIHEDLFRWFSLTLPYLRYRLKLAFEIDSGWNSNIAEKLVSCPGKLYVTSTHVDLVTDINNISIIVRKAGLDRDPGWNADFGRVVQFHFE